jgi:hypothetical protein
MDPMGSEHPQESRSSDDRQGDEIPAGTDRGIEDDGEREGGLPDRGAKGRVPACESDVSVDDLFELLARPGNRYTLAYLARADGPVSYEDLVEFVVDGADTPAGLSTADFRNQVATRLVHSNLPKLDDAGLVEYDRADRTVSATDATAVAVPYLELAMDQFSTE